jgi:putative peptidoglycan lipid II flippase
VLRRGIEASLFIGLPASAGMILVAEPASRLLFQHGRFTAADAAWVALSTALYSGAIWAFSLLQIVNRAYYALHDAATPLKWVVINLVINLVVEIPLIFTGLRESGMAVGTLVSFTIQAIAMLWMLNRRVGGIGLSAVAGNIGRMCVATAAMTLACAALRWTPIFAGGEGKSVWALELALTMAVGGGVYFAVCALLGMHPYKRLARRS